LIQKSQVQRHNDPISHILIHSRKAANYLEIIIKNPNEYSKLSFATLGLFRVIIRVMAWRGESSLTYTYGTTTHSIISIPIQNY
jgi:hypothetical protein